MMQHTKYLNEALEKAFIHAKSDRTEFVCPEHVLAALLDQDPFCKALFYECEVSEKPFTEALYRYLSQMERVPADVEYELQGSAHLNKMLSMAYKMAESAQTDTVDVPHLINAMMKLGNSTARTLIEGSIQCGVGEFLSAIVYSYKVESEMDELFEEDEEQTAPWRQFVTCMNEHLEGRNPLIGREKELERTIQVLCRKDKNNPLHVGEAGVGKTALVWGLAAILERGKVPTKLKGFKIYELDLGGLIAGAQFRGDFEKRLKNVMEGIRNEGHAIIYIDEIHNLVGAGQTGEGAMDATQMLRPYMEMADIRFIGSTTYQELNRYMTKQKGLLRRFQQIDIQEP